MNILSSAAYLTVLVTSLTGSLHCVAMCSGLMMNVTHNSRDEMKYHLGRLIGYLVLGATAGKLGEAFFSTDLLRSAQLIASLLLGIFFCWAAYRVWKKSPFHFNLVPQSLLYKLQSKCLTSNRLSSSFCIGLVSALLPCGWLHTFVIAAIATQTPKSGALLLFFFWAGTVPALSLSRNIFQKFTNPLAQFSSKSLAILLLIAGLSTLGLKTYPLLTTIPDDADTCPLHESHSH